MASTIKFDQIQNLSSVVAANVASDGRLTDLVTPIGSTDAATKGYVDSGLNGLLGIRGVSCKNNSTTPNTRYDLNASSLVLFTSSGLIARFSAPGIITCDVNVAGSIANGRDQSSAFGASNWIHFYWIYNGTTLATLSSLSATTPTLPAGYTYSAYAGAVYFNASSQLVKTRIFNNTAFYEAKQSILSIGTATSETTISLLTTIPPNASMFSFSATLRQANATAAGIAEYRIVSGSSFFEVRGYAGGAGEDVTFGEYSCEAPNISQNLFYLLTAVGANGNTSAWVRNYKIPNGAI